jgi:hypothetical protein
MRRTTADPSAKGAARPGIDHAEDDATTSEFDENPSYTVVAGSGSAMAGLGVNDAPTRESKNVSSVLAAHEAALDREKRVPTREVVVTPARLDRTDELNAAGPLARRDLPGSSDELADAPGTRTGLVLAQFKPRRWWSSPLFLVALSLVILGAATSIYWQLTARG